MPLISLLTDFGLLDPFVGEMKAVILSICPETRIVDITHHVQKFDVRLGSFLLAGAASYFPSGTIHVGVVDPGVGSSRRAIVVQSRRAVYVGPDNGLLVPAAQRESILHVYELTNRSFMRNEISAAFHGRDVFAPAAAHLACGKVPQECGPEISDYIRPFYSQPAFDGKAITCEVFHIDSFGNIVTNVSDHIERLRLKFGDKVSLTIKKKQVPARFVQTYSDLKRKEFGILFGSHGFLEIACREASAADRVHARIGSVVHVGGA
jgi:S-adenosyl-L-methionine hydrolase (adenosine-forming)